MVTPNPPISGHHLLSEGNVWMNREYQTWMGGCACGAKPPEFPNISMRKMKAWHRQHKAELRGQKIHDAATAEMQVEVLKELIKDFEAWAEHQDWCEGYVYDDGGARCSCGLLPLLRRAHDVLGSATEVAAPVEGATEPAPELQVPIEVDTRPRCNAPHPDGNTVACDKPRGHDGPHGVYYGWTGRAEVWS